MAAMAATDGSNGYGARYLLPVLAMLLLLALWTDAAPLAVPLLLALAATHEVLRPFCESFGDLLALAVHVAAAANVALLRFVTRGARPRFPQWTLAYEWFQAIAAAAGESHGAHILKPANALAMRRNFELIGRAVGAVSSWLHGTRVEAFEAFGLEHLWLRARRQPENCKRRLVVLYYHGGGYALFSPRFFVDFCNRLRRALLVQLAPDNATDVQVLLANYRKLPESAFPAPLDDALAMFDYLTRTRGVAPSDVVLAGDSAGGGLVLATLLRLRAAGRALPRAAVCSCPYVDLSADVAVAEHCFISKTMLDAIRTEAQREPSGAWLEGVMLERDLHGLPPLLVQAAEFDILHAQSLRLAQRAKAHGVAVELDLHRFMPHVFTLFPPFMLPYADVGVQHMAQFVARQLDGPAQAA